MSGFAVYTADQVSIIIATFTISDLMGPDEFLRIEKAEDDVAYEASADGGGTLNVLRNTEHTITLTLKKTSPANLKLSGMYKAGKLTSQGALIFPIVVVDRGSNGDIFASHQCAFRKLPDEAYASQAQDVEWAFVCHAPERFIGGH